MHDLVGVITGASSGMGRAAALALAARGIKLVLLGRNQHRLEQVRNEIMQVHPGAEADIFVMDLSSLREVREVAARIVARYPRIDILLNNAGAILGKRQTTAEGFEQSLATNHLGPFLLTRLLLERLVQSPAGRIIQVSSVAHKYAAPDLGDFQMTRNYNPWIAYSNVKLYNIMFVHELDRRLKAQGLPVVVNAVHPGAVRTGFGAEAGWLSRAMLWLMQPFFISAAQGADTSVYLATDPAAGHISGQYLVNRQVASLQHPLLTLEFEGALWQLSEELTGGTFL